ncbi:MAG: hypothetical protein FJW31_31345 [Acidobacteria bacterium]|nr:hypothetical protein [Acidobacteriota bacterium]
MLRGVHNQYTPGFQWDYSATPARPGSRVGYAANVFFLFYPAPGVQGPSTVTVGGFSFSSGYNVSRNSVLSPSDTIQVEDGEGYWSMSAYYPNAVMDGSNPLYEGIACRHGGGPGNGINGGRGVVVFADSPAEARPDEKINPQASNRLISSSLWDSQKRAGSL